MFGLERLPEILPVFPLTGALLLPKGHLPLHIFEPRYLDMVYYAREKNGMIGMIQPKGTPLSTREGHDQFGTAPRGRALYDTGCVGMISDMKENKQGGLTLMLTGLSRFDRVEEMPMTQTFREIRTSYDRYGTDCAEPSRCDDIDHQSLLLNVQIYLKNKNILPYGENLEQACDEELVNMLAMICPFEAAEKQAILEAVTLKDRVDLMGQMMTMSLSASAPPATDKYMQ